ncbi:MAG: 1,4-alpha-glucan branching protein GlgB [Flavobacteriaceae bacterium]
MHTTTIHHSLFTDFDIELFKAGKHFDLSDKLGAHPMTLDGVSGTYFAVWAPSAKSVSVIADFNCWIEGSHPLFVRWDGSGIWEGFVPGVKHGALYKYKIHSHHNQVVTEKADPFARRAEHPPLTASVVWDAAYDWKDQQWMQSRPQKQGLDKPFSVYEVHFGSWRRNAQGDFLSYREMADQLVPYVAEMGFTHVEFMPIMEYPYDPSWGYQLVGYFAPTSRFGTPEEFKYLVDTFHQHDIGVILDWVPSHFPSDDHGLGFFDGSHLYEHPDPRKGYHKDWKSLIFNYERPEVRAFLISNAVFWMRHFHIDGLRVDAVASMLYLDYSREDGEWEPNEFGGRENLAAASFLRELNAHLYGRFDGIQTIAEESTSFPMVSRPTDIGGLGFGMKWMMGWMHDTLEYYKKDPIYRPYHQNDITFSMTYAFTENFMLPLSHDEVVYGKNSLLGRMPGDEWQRFAQLRLMYAYMYTHPGAKLLFMGGEFGQYAEWNYNQSLDWHLTEYSYHSGVQKNLQALNRLYRETTAMHQWQFSAQGFEWMSYDDAQNSVLAYVRHGSQAEDAVLVVCNMTPQPHEEYRVGLPFGKKLLLKYTSDDPKFGGSGYPVAGHIPVESLSIHGRSTSAVLALPPLGAVVYQIL